MQRGEVTVYDHVIAALVIAMKWRSLLHGLVLVLMAMGAAGLMNTVRVLPVVIVWEKSRFDLSTGRVHDALSYATLGIAALLLMSADAGLDLFSAWIPDIRKRGLIAIYQNPFISFWNRYVDTSKQNPKTLRNPRRPLAARSLKLSEIAALLALAGQAVRLAGLI